MAVRNRLTKLRLDEISLVDDPANPGAQVTLFKRNGDTNMTQKSNLTPEALAEALQKAEAEVATQKARADAAEQRLAAVSKGGTVDPYANLAPEVAAELRKRDETVAKQAERIAKMEEGQELGEFIAKAAAFKHLPVDAAKVGPILRKAAKALSADEYAELTRLLKAGDEGVEKANLVKELGKGGGSGATTAEQTLAQRATDLAKKDGITFAKAYTRVLESDPKLYQQYLDEKGGK